MANNRYWLRAASSQTAMYSCRDCGALTDDPMLHDKFHAWLDAVDFRVLPSPPLAPRPRDIRPPVGGEDNPK